jgi:hypothetical protein
MIEEYPFSVVVQFRLNTKDDLGSTDELTFRHTQEEILGELLESLDVGICDGGQIGAGTMETFFYVSDVERAITAIIDNLTDRELIQWAKVASEKDNAWIVHYPKGAFFSLWAWDEKDLSI